MLRLSQDIKDRCAIALVSLFLTLLPAALLGRQARAAEWPVPQGPSHEPQPYQYDAARWQQVPHEFLEDAPACVLYSGNTYLVEPDGTTENIVHEITRFNGRKGIDKLGEYRNISYDPAFQKLTLHEACVHKVNGQTVQLTPRDAQLRDLSTDYQVYDHEKQLILSFPNLEVGDTIEVKWSVRGKNPEYQGYFFNRYTFGDDTYPVVLDELRVRLPKDRPLKYAVIGEGKLASKVQEEGDQRTYTWAASNRHELPQDDNLPSKEELRLQLACSTFTSWEEVGQWKQQLRADCWECTPEVRKLAQELTRDLKTPEEKARVLTYWVRRNIRYVSLGEKHDYTPHSPAQVLSARYGDCKDQSQMLAVMLREVGVPVALATLGVLDDGQVLESVPSPWGTHAILLVTLDGKDHWLDTTASLAGWDYLPRDDRDRLCYVVDFQGKLRLVRTPPMTADDNRIEQVTHVSVGADGSARCERSAVYHGHAALAQREVWVEAAPGERRRLLTNELQDANSRTRLVRLNIDEKALQDSDQPVSARSAFEIFGLFTGDPDLEGSIADSKVWGKLLAYNLDYDRTAPLDLYAPFDSLHLYEISLPPAYHFDGLPRDRSIRSKWGFFTLTAHADPDDPRHMNVELHTRLDRVKVDPADFEEFRKFHEEVTRYYRVWLTLKPAEDLEDVPALEAVLNWAPEDTASAAVLVRLYQQHNLSKDAHRVLNRARYYRPNDSTLAELTVKLTDTLEEEEAAYRDLVRRFPDEAKYQVLLGATLVNRGEHNKARLWLEPLTHKGSGAIRAQAYYQLARSSFRQGDAKKALENLDAATKIDADTTATVAAWNLRGQVQEKLGDPKEASLAYQLALKQDADSQETLLALMRLSWEQKDRADTLEYLRRYTLAVDNELEGLATAAEWHLRLGRYEDARDLAQRAREIGFLARTQRVLGLVALHEEDYEEAILHLSKADLDGQVLEGLVRSHLALGNLAEAEDQAGRLGQVSEPSPELRQLCERVKALVQRRRTLLQELHLPADREAAGRQALDHYLCAEDAHREGLPAARVEALLRGAFEDGMELGPACALRGLLALERGRLSRALTDAERALELTPGTALAYYVRGRVRLERGSKGALADLEKAAELSQRKDAEVLHWLASALSQAGRNREALTVQRQAVEQKPDDPELQEQLQELERAQATPGARTSGAGS